jgi:hypothetical protein
MSIFLGLFLSLSLRAALPSTAAALHLSPHCGFRDRAQSVGPSLQLSLTAEETARLYSLLSSRARRPVILVCHARSCEDLRDEFARLFATLKWPWAESNDALPDEPSEGILLMPATEDTIYMKRAIERVTALRVRVKDGPGPRRLDGKILISIASRPASI